MRCNRGSPTGTCLVDPINSVGVPRLMYDKATKQLLPGELAKLIAPLKKAEASFQLTRERPASIFTPGARTFANLVGNASLIRDRCVVQLWPEFSSARHRPKIVARRRKTPATPRRRGSSCQACCQDHRRLEIADLGRGAIAL